MEWFFHVGHSFKEFISSLELSFKDIYSSMTLFCGCHILCAVASVSTLSNVLPPSSGKYDILEKTLNSQGKGYFFYLCHRKMASQGGSVAPQVILLSTIWASRRKKGTRTAETNSDLAVVFKFFTLLSVFAELIQKNTQKKQQKQFTLLALLYFLFRHPLNKNYWDSVGGEYSGTHSQWSPGVHQPSGPVWLGLKDNLTTWQIFLTKKIYMMVTQPIK